MFPTWIRSLCPFFDDFSSDRYISSKYLCVSPDLQIFLIAGVTKAMAANKTRSCTKHNGGIQLASDTFTTNARAFLFRNLFVNTVVILTPLVSRPYMQTFFNTALQSVRPIARASMPTPERSLSCVLTRFNTPAPSNRSRVMFAFRAD